MLTKFARLVERLTGSVLGSLAVSVQAGTVCVCLAFLLLGPKAIL